MTAATETVTYFVESRDAARARESLKALGVTFTDKPWQTGIRRFEIAASDASKLSKVFA